MLQFLLPAPRSAINVRSITPLQQSFRLHEFQGSIAVDVRMNGLPHVFTVDIYSYSDRNIPRRIWDGGPFLPRGKSDPVLCRFPIGKQGLGENHCGWGQDLMQRLLGESFVFARSSSGSELVLRDDKLQIQQLEHVIMKIDDSMVLKQFYARLHAGGGYGTPLPFLPTMHFYKLSVLQKLFTRYVPGREGAGSRLRALSFTDIQPNWPFQIFAGDLDLGLIRERKREVPQITGSSPMPRMRRFKAVRLTLCLPVRSSNMFGTLFRSFRNGGAC